MVSWAHQHTPNNLEKPSIYRTNWFGQILSCVDLTEHQKSSIVIMLWISNHQKHFSKLYILAMSSQNTFFVGFGFIWDPSNNSHCFYFRCLVPHAQYLRLDACLIFYVRCLMLDLDAWCLMHAWWTLSRGSHRMASCPKCQPAPGVRGRGDTGPDLARARWSRPQSKVIVG